MANGKDQAKYVQLITECQQRLYAYILTMIPGNQSMASDVLQETNLVLWRKIDDYEPGTNFNAWAYKIAYFQTLAHLKKAKRQKWLCFDSELLSTLGEEMDEQHQNFEEEHRVLRSCIEELSHADTTLVKQRYFEETPLKDLASALGRSVGALKQAMFRIRRTLKTCVQRKCALEMA